MILLSRLIAALAYAGAAFSFGLVLGQRGELGIVQQIFLYVVPFATFILALVTKSGGRANVLLTGVAMFAGVLHGQRQFARAWDECTLRGYDVRDALARHHAQHDGYPARLEDLDIALPCRCGFRKTILRYLSNERGFRLWMTNDREVISFNSTERSSTPPRSSAASTPPD